MRVANLLAPYAGLTQLDESLTVEPEFLPATTKNKSTKFLWPKDLGFDGYFGFKDIFSTTRCIIMKITKLIGNLWITLFEVDGPIGYKWG